MLRYVSIDNTQGNAPVIKDYPQFDKFSKLNIEFILMDASNGDRQRVEMLLKDEKLVIDATRKVAYMNGFNESLRIYQPI